MLTSHLLPEAAFRALAGGAGRPATIRLLRDAQLSKQLMLLHGIAAAAGAADASAEGAAAFRGGYALLAELQAADAGSADWLLGLPHLGSWAHDCLIHLERGSAPDFAHFACLAAAAAVRGGVPFRSPGPGARRPGPAAGARVHPDRRGVVVGPAARRRGTGDGREQVPGRPAFPGPRRRLRRTVPRWSGTPLIRAVTDGLAWQVLLETEDSYLDRYTLPMATGLRAEHIQHWRQRAQAAWQVLVRHHRWAAESLPDVVSVIVPLTAHSETDLVSVTTPAASGAIATSWPPDPVIMAETLIHEGQHVKLCGLLDMVPLVTSGGEWVYAPWRQDPRPVGGLLQGVYAHLGIVRFWNAQRYAETDPDDALRAQVHFARWRTMMDEAAQTLLRTDCLTPAGVRFVGLLRAQGRLLLTEPVPADALEISGQAALDHRLTWQLRHLAVDPAGAASLAEARRRGESGRDRARPTTWIEADIRNVKASVRSRLLSMRYLAPARYRELCADGTLTLSEADRLLAAGRAEAAIRAYRDEITTSADPRPDAWVGLALALHELPPSPVQQVFATDLVLMFDVHGRLGVRSDPLELAGWFA